MRVSDRTERRPFLARGVESDMAREKGNRGSDAVMGCLKTARKLDEQGGGTLYDVSKAFQHGMAAPWRAVHSGRWDNGKMVWWGGLGNKADAILNLYAQ